MNDETNPDELTMHIEKLMQTMPPAEFKKLCEALGVDPAGFKQFLDEDVKRQTN